MALVAQVLIDTSAAARIRQPAVAEVLDPLLERGLAATCGSLDFEALHTARTPSEYELIRVRRRLAYGYLPTLDDDWHRAMDIQAQLARQSRLREVGASDLLIAAVAERESVTILHYDADFDTIAGVTGQTVRWVMPPGSLD